MSTVTPVPVFTRLELWDDRVGDWTVAHAGINLLSPSRYVERLAAKGKVARAVVVDTGEVFQVLPSPQASPCPYCLGSHPLPHDGSCLL